MTCLCTSLFGFTARSFAKGVLNELGTMNLMPLNLANFATLGKPTSTCAFSHTPYANVRGPTNAHLFIARHSLSNAWRRSVKLHARPAACCQMMEWFGHTVATWWSNLRFSSGDPSYDGWTRMVTSIERRYSCRATRREEVSQRVQATFGRCDTRCSTRTHPAWRPARTEG